MPRAPATTGTSGPLPRCVPPLWWRAPTHAGSAPPLDLLIRATARLEAASPLPPRPARWLLMRCRQGGYLRAPSERAPPLWEELSLSTQRPLLPRLLRDLNSAACRRVGPAPATSSLSHSIHPATYLSPTSATKGKVSHAWGSPTTWDTRACNPASTARRER